MDLQPGMALSLWDQVGKGRKIQYLIKERSQCFCGVNFNALFCFESKKNVILEMIQAID